MKPVGRAEEGWRQAFVSPLAYLAEFLFKENPEGKMFEPDYTETMSMLLDAIERLQQDILPCDQLDKDLKEYLKVEVHPENDFNEENQLEFKEQSTLSISKQTYFTDDSEEFSYMEDQERRDAKD